MCAVPGYHMKVKEVMQLIHKHKHAAVTHNQGMEYTEDSGDAFHAVYGAQKLINASQ